VLRQPGPQPIQPPSKQTAAQHRNPDGLQRPPVVRNRQPSHKHGHNATHFEWFSDQLARACQIEADLEAMNIPIPTPLSDASQTLMRIVEVCQKHYELYARNG
jgi:hypothetical protein